MLVHSGASSQYWWRKTKGVTADIINARADSLLEPPTSRKLIDDLLTWKILDSLSSLSGIRTYIDEGQVK